ncbi:hypothetical protein V8C44DRAFT_330203 [Trichoderma aethiopicum]
MKQCGGGALPRISKLLKVNPSESYPPVPRANRQYLFVPPALEAVLARRVAFRASTSCWSRPPHHSLSMKTSIMQPSHAWARTHTTQPPHATAASCHLWQPVTTTHLRLERVTGRQRTTCTFRLLLFGSTGDQANAAGKKGESSKKGSDGGCPGPGLCLD